MDIFLDLVSKITAAFFVISMVMGALVLLFVWLVAPFWKKQADLNAEYERALAERMEEIARGSATGFSAWSERHPG